MSDVAAIRLAKFGLVGISGMIIDFGVTWLLKERLRFNKYLSNSVGFTCAVISNFSLNRNWTFEQQGTGVTLQFTKFLLVSLTGLALNNLLLYGFLKKTKMNFYLAKVFVTGLVFFWNYSINVLFTFN